MKKSKLKAKLAELAEVQGREIRRLQVELNDAQQKTQVFVFNREQNI